jgi:CheY-like chemotaxis protein
MSPKVRASKFIRRSVRRSSRPPIRSFKPPAVILDLVMPGTDGIECLRYLADLGCTAPILVMSGYSGKLLESARSLGDAFGLPFVRSLEKPIRVKLLRTALASAS